MVWDRGRRAPRSATPSCGSAAARRLAGGAGCAEPRRSRPDGHAPARALCPMRTSLPARSRWILDNVPGAREDARRGRRAAAFGTVDTWLVWALTQRRRARHGRHQREPHHALQHPRAWTGTRSCLSLFGIPAPMLPEVRPASGDFGETSYSRRSSAGHPHHAAWRATSRRRSSASAAFAPARRRTPTAPAASCCMNTGHEAVRVAEWSGHHRCRQRACERGAPSTRSRAACLWPGALVQWLRDELGLIDNAAETRDRRRSVPDTGGRLHRARLHGPGRPLLGRRRARHASWASPAGPGRAHLVAGRVWNRSPTRCATWW